MPAKIKLLFRNRSLEMGGTESVLLTLLQELDPARYDITLLLNYHEGEFLHRVPPSVRVLNVGRGRQLFSSNKMRHLLQKAARRLRYFYFQKCPRTFYQKQGLMEQDMEIAFSHYMYTDVLNSPNKKSKKVFWFHGDLRNSGLTFSQNADVVKQMQRFDTGVFVSHFSKRMVEETWHTLLPHAIVIHNPIPAEEILSKAAEMPPTNYGKIDFISVGRLFAQKGFMDLLQAHVRLIKEGYQIQTLLVGNGIQRAELERHIAENGVADNFILAGYHSNPFPYMRAAACFVLPSYSEGYPLVIAESLLLETPVRCTDVGGVSEILPQAGDAVKLFAPGPDNVYDAMKEFLHMRNNNLPNEKNAASLMADKNAQIFKQIETLLNPKRCLL